MKKFETLNSIKLSQKEFILLLIATSIGATVIAIVFSVITHLIASCVTSNPTEIFILALVQYFFILCYSIPYIAAIEGKSVKHYPPL